MDVIIAPHSCRNGNLPQTVEGKILATADAITHLSKDFYLQFAWMHLPEEKTYTEYKEWVNEKLNRDFNIKLFFPEIKAEMKDRHEALIEVFSIA